MNKKKIAIASLLKKMHIPMPFSKKTIFLTGFFILLITGRADRLLAVQDYGSLTANISTVTDNRTLNVLTNPAYLVFQNPQKTSSVAFSVTPGYYIKSDISGITNLSLIDRYTALSSLGFEMHGLFGGKWALGLGLGGIDTVAYSSLKMSGEVNPDTFSYTITKSSIDYNILSSSTGVFLSGAYMFSPQRSLGFSLMGQMQKNELSSTAAIDFSISGTAVSIDTASDVTQSSGIYAAQVTWLEKSPAGDIAFSLIPAFYHDFTNNQKKKSSIKTTTTTTVDEEKNYTDTFVKMPLIKMGISQNFFSFMKMYLEAGVQFGSNYTYRELIIAGSAAYDHTVEVTEKTTPKLAVGWAFELNGSLTLYTGINAERNSGLYYSSTTDSASTEPAQEESKSGDSITLTAGTGFYASESLSFYTGAAFSQLFEKTKTIKYKTSGSSEETNSTTRLQFITLHLGMQYEF